MFRMMLQTSAVYLLIFSSLTSAQENDKKTNFTFWSRLTLGQVVSSSIEKSGIYDIPFDKEWLETIDGGIKITQKISSTLTGRLNLGVVVNLATVPENVRSAGTAAKKVTPVLLDASLEYRHGGLFLDNDSLAIELGFFPFKYNFQSTNLGEYLFRSGTYPGWLVSGFEHSIDRPKLAGVHISYTMGSTVSLKQDLIVNTELDVVPYRDIHLTYIATPSIGRFLNLGLGIQLARLIVLDPHKTTIGSDPIYNDKWDNKNGYKHIVMNIDSTSNLYDTIYDTTLTKYTFRGTKLMGRAMFDIKQLFGGCEEIFGSEDLKLYGEMAILGVKNYSGWYSKRKDRIPMMIGFNFPAFKVLDVLSIEVERYQSPYINTQDFIWQGSSPVPYISGIRAPIDYDDSWNDSMAVTDDDIRWSIYASKKIGNHIRLSAQAACDHTPKFWHTPSPPSSVKYSDMVPKNDDWYFMMRMSLYF